MINGGSWTINNKTDYLKRSGKTEIKIKKKTEENPEQIQLNFKIGSDWEPHMLRLIYIQIQYTTHFTLTVAERSPKQARKLCALTIASVTNLDLSRISIEAKSGQSRLGGSGRHFGHRLNCTFVSLLLFFRVEHFDYYQIETANFKFSTSRFEQHPSQSNQILIVSNETVRIITISQAITGPINK